MRSDGSVIHRITETDGDYFGIGWMPEDDDSQHITYSLGMNNTTYWIERTGTITNTTVHTPILVDEQPMNGTNPKWNPFGQMIYLSQLDGRVYRANWFTTPFELSDNEAVSPEYMLIKFYDWANQWGDIILGEVDIVNGVIVNLYRYRDGLSENGLSEIELNRSISHVMTAPDTPFLVASVYETSFDSYVQLIELTSTDYILGTPWYHGSGSTGLYAPHLSPDGSQIHAVNCSWLFSNVLYDTYCYESYLYVDEQPTQIFAGTPIDHFPVREWDIFRLPSPSNSDMCKAEVGEPDDGSNTFVVRETIGGNVIGRPRKETEVFVLGVALPENMPSDIKLVYLIKGFDSDPEKLGWIADIGLIKDSFIGDGCKSLKLLNALRDEIQADFDYELKLPIPEWWNDDDKATKTVTIEDWQDNDAKNWADDNCLAAPVYEEGQIPSDEIVKLDQQELNQNCTLVVFVIYYDLFKQLNNGRAPKLSDILATGYEVEVQPIAQQGQAELAQEALAGNYFQQVREYCKAHRVERTLSTDIITIVHGNESFSDCTDRIINNKEIPIEDLVGGWYKWGDCGNDYYEADDCTGVQLYKRSGYLWTLQAWYHNAVAIKDWYYNYRDSIPLTNLEPTPDGEQPSEQLTPQEEDAITGKERLRFLLLASSEHQLIGVLQLVEGKQSSRFLDWGNFGYEGPYLANTDLPYTRAILGWETPSVVHPVEMLYCQLNLAIQRDPLQAREDVFAVIDKNGETGGLGSTSTASWDNPPDWRDNPDYTGARIGDNPQIQGGAFGSKTSLVCPCAQNSPYIRNVDSNGRHLSNGVPYPSNIRCYPEIPEENE